MIIYNFLPEVIGLLNTCGDFWLHIPGIVMRVLDYFILVEIFSYYSGYCADYYLGRLSL